MRSCRKDVYNGRLGPGPSAGMPDYREGFVPGDIGVLKVLEWEEAFRWWW